MNVIRPSCRAHFTVADLDFLIAALGAHPGFYHHRPVIVTGTLSFRDPGEVRLRDEAGDAAAPLRAGDRAPDAQGMRRLGFGFPLRLFDLLRGTGHVLLAQLPGEAEMGALDALEGAYEVAAAGTASGLSVGANAGAVASPLILDRITA